MQDFLPIGRFVEHSLNPANFHGQVFSIKRLQVWPDAPVQVPVLPQLLSSLSTNSNPYQLSIHCAGM